jgi:SAM-dependent methyltransferase
MFIDADAAAREIARILKPGGRFVATAAESLVEPFMPTVVRDYRPIFESAGFRTVYHEPIEGRDAAQLRFYLALEARGDRLRLEIGEAAEILIEEARNGIERARTGTLRIRDVLFVAEKIG